MISPHYRWKPKFRISLNKLVFELTFWRPNVCLKWPGFLTSVYFSPTLSDKLVHWWPQKSAYYAKGFVFRALWFGFIVRRISVQVKRKKSLGQMIDDWVPDDAIDFEADRLIALADLDERDLF